MFFIYFMLNFNAHCVLQMKIEHSMKYFFYFNSSNTTSESFLVDNGASIQES
jgi:hypothetical protein